MIALLKIEWLRMTRNKKYIFFTAAMPIAFFIVFSSMIKGADKLFVEQFMLSMTTFCLTSFAFLTFRLILWKIETMVGMKHFRKYH